MTIHPTTRHLCLGLALLLSACGTPDPSLAPLADSAANWAWSTDPSQPAPPPGTVTLESNTMIRGQTLTVVVTDAPPGAQAVLLATTQLNAPPACPPQLAPVCLDIGRFVVLASQPTSLSGDTVFEVAVPPNVPVDVIGLQVAVLSRGVGHTSNVLVLDVLDPIPDSDGDGLNDAREAELGTDPFDVDTDNDLLEDGDELAYGTDPLDYDTDGDSLVDGSEVHLFGTSPLLADTDGGGELDGIEIAFGRDPLLADDDLPCCDTDGDGIPDCWDTETCDGLDNNGDGVIDEGFPDTDGDGLADCIDDATCGNAMVEPGEICDDGANGDDSDGCFDDCTAPLCGDGVVQLPETCDPAAPFLVAGQVLDYPDFTDTTGLQLNGHAAALPNGVLRVVSSAEYQRGSVFSTTPVQTARFNSHFVWKASEIGGQTEDTAGRRGGDGLAFVIQNLSNDVGVTGGGIGYQGLTPSIAVELDTFLNPAFDDPSTNHVGIMLNGNPDHTGQATANVALDFESGADIYVWVDFDGTTMSVFIGPTSSKPATPDITRDVGATMASILSGGQAFVGFTSATGGAHHHTDVLSWRFEGDDQPCRDDCTFCGDGIVDVGETCDDGNTDDLDTCSNTCEPCGDEDLDGVCDLVDRCPGYDDHRDADGDTVPDACDICPEGDDLVDRNGDGIPDACEEECDGIDNDSNGLIDEGFPDTDADGIADCVDPQTCGNGLTELPEICDDGANGDDTDGCFDDCTAPVCGDGLVQPPETCETDALVTSGIDLDYPDFYSTAGLQLNGNAVVHTDGTLRIVPSASYMRGSVFSILPMGAANFTTSFVWRTSGVGGIPEFGLIGGDGMAFVIQNLSNAVGITGGGIGYQGLSPSIAVEFDTFGNNDFADPNGNHVGIMVNGVTHHSGQPARTAPMDFESGNDIYVWIDFDGTTLDVYLSDLPAKPAAIFQSRNVSAEMANILANGEAFVGFTASTGGAFHNTDIVSWQFDGDTLIDCREDCSFCGDGIVDSIEACDDGNTEDLDACSNTCEPCADGDVDGVCDLVDVCPGFDDNLDLDGDTVPDGCDVCYGADDLVDLDADGVPDACQEICDGIDNDQDELIDEGFEDLDLDGIADCVDDQVCGNGVVELNEACDDGANNDDTDLCLDDCTVPAPACGDGFLQPPETCDTSALLPFSTDLLDYADFYSTAGLQLNGNAAVIGDGSLRLVPSATYKRGSAFTTAPMRAAEFSTAFVWRISAVNGVDPALWGGDGMAFVIQNVSNAVGVTGGGMGYQGLTPSVAVEFDTFANSDFADPDGNHVGIMVGGNPNHSGQPTASVALDFESGVDLHVWIDFDGTDLDLYLSDMPSKPATPILSRDVSAEMTSVLANGRAFVGFTSSTGGAVHNTDIVSWQYDGGHVDACRDDCSFCGDGVVDPTEGCDDGNDIDDDACSNTCTFSCNDDDGDGVCNDEDICPLGPDDQDSDRDRVPNACDVCEGGDDRLDADLDGVPDGCDVCPDGNDLLDADFDGIPDDCFEACDCIDNDQDGEIDEDCSYLVDLDWEVWGGNFTAFFDAFPVSGGTGAGNYSAPVQGGYHSSSFIASSTAPPSGFSAAVTMDGTPITVTGDGSWSMTEVNPGPSGWQGNMLPVPLIFGLSDCGFVPGTPVSHGAQWSWMPSCGASSSIPENWFTTTFLVCGPE